MKASFGQRDIPLFHSLVKQYTTVSLVENARKSLKTFALGYNNQKIYEDTLESILGHLATALNKICEGLEKDEDCDFFKKHKIFFDDFHSFNAALNVVSQFKSTPNKPYATKVNQFISNDLFSMLNIFVGIHNYSRTREEEEPDLRDRKRPILRDIANFHYLMVGPSKSTLRSPKADDPLLNCYSLIKSSYRENRISQENFDKLHSYFEKLLINGWGYYYNRITAGFSSKSNLKQYNNVLKKLEVMNSHIINVSMIGRNTRQINTLDAMHTFTNDIDRNLMVELHGFFSNMNSLYLCYCYLTDRIIREEPVKPDMGDKTLTFTCAYCGKTFGSKTAVVADHKILSSYLNGLPQKVTCPGKKHPPLEISNSGLHLRSEVERTAYNSAMTELEGLNHAKELYIEGKYSMRIFTPKDLSWNSRLTKAKEAQAEKVAGLKAIVDATDKQIKEWVPTPIEDIPFWTPKKPQANSLETA
jgi:5-methylcytosine-specific restriction endonuclease McrA